MQISNQISTIAWLFYQPYLQRARPLLLAASPSKNGQATPTIPTQPVYPSGPIFSPDGRHYWDYGGQKWRRNPRGNGGLFWFVVSVALALLLFYLWWAA